MREGREERGSERNFFQLTYEEEMEDPIEEDDVEFKLRLSNSLIKCNEKSVDAKEGEERLDNVHDEDE